MVMVLQNRSNEEPKHLMAARFMDEGEKGTEKNKMMALMEWMWKRSCRDENSLSKCWSL